MLLIKQQEGSLGLPSPKNYSMNIEISTIDSIINNPDNYSEDESVFGEYIHQGDLALIVGDTNSGKTLLALDIALANNDSLCYWDEPMSSIRRKTIYIDGEHNDSQIARRYGGLLDCSSGGLVRGKFTGMELDTCLEDRLFAIKELIGENKDTKLLVIDNLMCLMDSGTSVRQAKQAVQELKRIKEFYGLTIILVVHLNKHSGKKPIEVQDIMGSSVIANYADSIVAVGNSCEGDNVKYLKHLKSRSTIKTSEVAIMEIVEDPYLHFEFREYDMEENHLPQKFVSRSSISPSIGEEVFRLREHGLTVRNIAGQLGLSKSAVGRFLRN